MKTKKQELENYVENAENGTVDIQQCGFGYSVIIFTKKEDATIGELNDEITEYVCSTIANSDNFVFQSKNQVAYRNVIDYIFDEEQMFDYINWLEKQDEFTFVTSNVKKFADSLEKNSGFPLARE